MAEPWVNELVRYIAAKRKPGGFPHGPNTHEINEIQDGLLTGAYAQPHTYPERLLETRTDGSPPSIPGDSSAGRLGVLGTMGTEVSKAFTHPSPVSPNVSQAAKLFREMYPQGRLPVGGETQGKAGGYFPNTGTVGVNKQETPWRQFEALLHEYGHAGQYNRPTSSYEPSHTEWVVNSRAKSPSMNLAHEIGPTLAGAIGKYELARRMGQPAMNEPVPIAREDRVRVDAVGDQYGELPKIRPEWARKMAQKHGVFDGKYSIFGGRSIDSLLATKAGKQWLRKIAMQAGMPNRRYFEHYADDAVRRDLQAGEDPSDNMMLIADGLSQQMSQFPGPPKNTERYYGQ